MLEIMVDVIGFCSAAFPQYQARRWELMPARAKPPTIDRAAFRRILGRCVIRGRLNAGEANVGGLRMGRRAQSKKSAHPKINDPAL